MPSAHLVFAAPIPSGGGTSRPTGKLRHCHLPAYAVFPPPPPREWCLFMLHLSPAVMLAGAWGKWWEGATLQSCMLACLFPAWQEKGAMADWSTIVPEAGFGDLLSIALQSPQGSLLWKGQEGGSRRKLGERESQGRERREQGSRTYSMLCLSRYFPTCFLFFKGMKK